MAAESLAVEPQRMDERRRPRRIGILAGGGSLPLEIAECASARGNIVTIVAIDGEADGTFESFPVTRVNWGQIGGMIRALKAAGAEELVIVGRVRRPDLMRIKTDLGFFLNLPAIVRIVASGGDDSVLRRVVRFFEGHNLRVLGPADVAPELVIGKAVLSRLSPTQTGAGDIAHGFAAIRALGPYDVGQSVIVRGGAIEAIEGAEGTDAMLERAARGRDGAPRRPGGVLVKRTKPGQDLRVDMPAVGPETVARAAEAGVEGIALEAGRVLIARRAETVRRADAAGIFIAGCEDRPEGEEAEPALPSRPLRTICLTLRRPRAADEADIAKGAAVLGALAPFGVGGAAVVARNHVLAVESGEGIGPMLERASRLRQWGRMGTLSQRGAVVLAHSTSLDPAFVPHIGAAGIAGVAVMDGPYTGEAMRDTVTGANNAGLFAVVRMREYEAAE